MTYDEWDKLIDLAAERKNITKKIKTIDEYSKKLNNRRDEICGEMDSILNRYKLYDHDNISTHPATMFNGDTFIVIFRDYEGKRHYRIAKWKKQDFDFIDGHIMRGCVIGYKLLQNITSVELS